ncbi:MAG TPA: hypothetical protein VFN66_08925 [Burkholderiales bacterium]|nr:hypothetical protein [Burkholderiales bacterium]
MSILLAKLLNYRPVLPDEEEINLRRFVTASRHVIGWLLIQLLLATVIMLPFNETANAGTSFASKTAPTGYGTDTDTDPSPTAWHNWVADPDHWITYPAINAWTSPVSVPTDNFTLFGTGTFMPGTTGGVGVSAEMITGDKWITLGRETVGMAGISNQQISSAMEKFPKNAAYVFAQYSPDSATGRIVIQKVEKMPDGKIKVYQADFTPWSGELWKAQGKYRTVQEISNGDPGYNPFAIFEGAKTDPLFHNLSWEAMEVAVGHAMRHYGATFAFVARAQTNSTQNTSTDNSLFSTKATTTVNVYAQPQWYVATPMEGTPSGETGQICVTGGAGVTTSSCDDPAHVAIAGVMFSPWSGGNMPQYQDLMYSLTDSQSNWNVLFFTVIITLATWGMAAVLAPEIIAADGGLSLAAGTAEDYALASTVFGSGGSLLQTQKGFFGATGNGWEQQMVATGSPVSQQIQNGTMNSVNSNFVAVPMGTGGMTATDALYNGGCPAGFSVAQCQASGKDPGTIWRPNSYAEYNGTKAMRQRNYACTTLADEQGLHGDARRAWIEQCAAPAVKAMQY